MEQLEETRLGGIGTMTLWPECRTLEDKADALKQPLAQNEQEHDVRVWL